MQHQDCESRELAQDKRSCFTDSFENFKKHLSIGEPNILEILQLEQHNKAVAQANLTE